MAYKYILKFSELQAREISKVGGKNASLAIMIQELSHQGVSVPDGFAITAQAYWHVIDANNLRQAISDTIAKLTDYSNLDQLDKVGGAVRLLLQNAKIPDDLVQEIKNAYQELNKEYAKINQGHEIHVAVRSSATAEDLPSASFAGQQETSLNVSGEDNLLRAVQYGMVSLFTNRAIVYRIEQKIDHLKVGISIGVQKMIRSDLACSGVAFTIDTETGFKDVVVINGVYGLGEYVVQGVVTPDEFIVHKPTLELGFRPILKKLLGKKDKKLVYNTQGQSGVHDEAVPADQQNKFVLTDDEILEVSRICLSIEKLYSQKAGAWQPQDIEWAKDGQDGKIYIVQARPETVYSQKQTIQTFTTYQLRKDDQTNLLKNIILTGISVGQSIVCGIARVINSIKDIDQVKKGDILVTDMTDPDWVPIMKKVSGIITNSGGRTCHAAIVSRELSIPAIVGTQYATEKIKNGQKITLDTSSGAVGYVYDGELPIEKKEINLTTLKPFPVKLYLNLGDPDQAFLKSRLPVDGIGLARLEFIIANSIKVHPMALLNPEKIQDKSIVREIEQITRAYASGPDFFVTVLARNIAMIVAAFYPRPVIVRLSDFKSNEYRNLVGGKYFEPEEENPMLGLRGASRYTSDWYAAAFALECTAMKMVRETMGLKNMKIMIPFVRTVSEAQRVIGVLDKHGLKRGDNGLEFVMMVEIPSNCLLIDQFANYFDGFSIGSNDLTQLTLGVDRDSSLVANLFDERDLAVKELMRMSIIGAKKAGKFIGICGQAPSDYPELAKFLIDSGITSISLNTDAVMSQLLKT